MGKRPTGSGGEPSSPNRGYSAGGKARLIFFLRCQWQRAAVSPCRDHYSGEVGQIDPQLFHLLHHLRQTLGTEQPFEIISGYRSPLTNATLRQSRAGGVAKRSLHMEGKALDVRLPGVPLSELRDAALDLRAGGVGFYPREQFVHIDTGAVRHWAG